MKQLLNKVKETADTVIAEFNGRAEEVKANIADFTEVFGKEYHIQTENFKGYRTRLESKGRKIFSGEEFIPEMKEELEHAIEDLRAFVDRMHDSLKERLHKAK